MNVVLIAPPIMDNFGGPLRPIAMDAVKECPPYGIYLLTSVLRAEGHEVALADLIADGANCVAKYAKAIAESDLVGIGATSMSWPTACDVIGQIRQIKPDVPIVLGGIHPTMFDYYILNSFPVDFIVRGEGELALIALCEALEGKRGFESVPNLSWKPENKGVARNPIGQKIGKGDLAEFPLPDFSQIPEGVYKGLSIESSRGCAFDCSFCSTSYRKTWRGMPADVFVDRLESVMDHVGRTGYQMIHIIDDEFSMNPRRATEIANIIRARGLKPALVYDSRANDLLVDGYVESIADYTTQFLVGAECGYDEGLKRIGKGVTTEILTKAAKKLLANNLAHKADFSFVLGLPWETKTEVEQTCRFASHLFATYGVRILLQWYCQIPGSRLWEADRAAGLVTEAMYNDYGFFSNLYLFRSGVKVEPAEIWEISHKVSALQIAAKLRYPDRTMVEYGSPDPINIYYPEEVMQGRPDGLASLREVAFPPRPDSEIVRLEPFSNPIPVSTQRPLRHIN